MSILKHFKNKHKDKTYAELKNELEEYEERLEEIQDEIASLESDEEDSQAEIAAIKRLLEIRKDEENNEKNDFIYIPPRTDKNTLMSLL